MRIVARTFCAADADLSSTSANFTAGTLLQPPFAQGLFLALNRLRAWVKVTVEVWQTYKHVSSTVFCCDGVDENDLLFFPPCVFAGKTPVLGWAASAPEASPRRRGSDETGSTPHVFSPPLSLNPEISRIQNQKTEVSLMYLFPPPLRKISEFFGECFGEHLPVQ